MSIIATLLQRIEFADQPPVLLDVGASGTLHRQWKPLAKRSICIAFDADQREFGYVTDDSGSFGKLYIYKCIVADKASDACAFYLTRSPFCSSTLMPDAQGLRPWAFGPKFEVVETISLRSNTLPNVMKEIGITSIDWFKTDSQGTDLRLFRSLAPEVLQKVIAADFEPGIIDSYVGEDKLHELLRFMDAQPFWMSHMKVKGPERLSAADLDSLSGNRFMQKLLSFSLVTSPGWAEVGYLNTMEGSTSLRDHLLSWIFATIQRQYGFALSIARKGKQQFTDPVFSDLERESIRRLRWNVAAIRFFPAVIEKLTKVFTE
ncbi:MAG: hypothetical protein NTV54_12185 [Ignavibacteriales bacterium]|nr:hypothetical protein [Ignavibacteriales bacterium]